MAKATTGKKLRAGETKVVRCETDAFYSSLGDLGPPSAGLGIGLGINRTALMSALAS